MPTVIIDPNKCTGCQACIGACPKNVFDFDDSSNKAVVARVQDCDGCRTCEGVCADCAITVND